jgi:shikimate kinase
VIADARPDTDTRPAAGPPAANRGAVIVLVGFMGAGKTTVGGLLAEKLGIPFTDSDFVIEDRAGKPVRAIFADHGEPAFRQLEHEVIASLLAGPSHVLALGGGAATHPGTRELLAAVPVAYLRVSYAEAMNRVGGDGGRPVLGRPDIEQVYAQRDPLYAAAATFTVDTDGRSPGEIALDILGRLPSAGPGPY